MSLEKIFQQMLARNRQYQTTRTNPSDISPDRRTELAKNGQHPYAAIVTCADSRVVPEHIFLAGLGELFTVRTAGNTVDDLARGSIEYAVRHLGVRLIIVMGHSHCGAVAAALNAKLNQEPASLVRLIRDIRSAIGDTTDPKIALERNIKNSIEQLLKSSFLAERDTDGEIIIKSLIYDMPSGKVQPIA